MKSPIVVGITGGIGGGKSTLAEKLRAEGYLVYDSDKEARRLQNEHPLIVEQLKEVFGAAIYDVNGLNRKELAKIVFSQKELLSKLNNIVHPVVRQDFVNWIEKNSHLKILFVESAILFESGFSAYIDKVVVMTATEAIRIKRVIKRDGITEDQVKARMSNQSSEDEKISRADYVIHSDDNRVLVHKMRKLLEYLLENAVGDKSETRFL